MFFSIYSLLRYLFFLSSKVCFNYIFFMNETIKIFTKDVNLKKKDLSMTASLSRACFLSLWLVLAKSLTNRLGSIDAIHEAVAVFCHPTGTGRKPSPIVEQSSMVVETVEKKTGVGGKVRRFRGDASKVVAKGPGLKKAFTNRLQSFTIETKDAGALIVKCVSMWTVCVLHLYLYHVVETN